MTTKTNKYNYRTIAIPASQLISPRETYQRELFSPRAKEIASKFDERIANEPKVSYRDGKYYVFDGQHTIGARVLVSGDKDIPIKCKVYYGMDEQEEALLFAQQNGISAPLTAGARMRAQIFGKDSEATAFYAANVSIGLALDFDHNRGLDRIGCIKTAFNAYKRIGEERYMEAMKMLKAAWDGDPDSFRTENIIAITYFVDRYHGEYCPQRLVTRLRSTDPLKIHRDGRAVGVNLTGYKKYLFPLLCIYNENAGRNELPMKF